MSTSFASNPFDTSAFLTLPRLRDESESILTWQGFHFDGRLENEFFRLADLEEKELGQLKTGLFQLKLDQDVLLTPVDALSVSEYATADEDNEETRLIKSDTTTGGVVDEDVWLLPNISEYRKMPRLASWNHFLQENHQEPPSAYLSEAGPDVFDAVVKATCKIPVQRVKLDEFLNALYELALGRNSAIFTWDAQTSSFRQNVESFTVTGFMPGTIQAVVDEFKLGGRLFRMIQRHRPDDAANRLADMIAFYAVLRSCILAIEAYMELQRTNISTLLGLRRVFEGPLSLLQICQQLSSIFEATKTPSGTVHLQSLFNAYSAYSVQHPQFRPVINHVLAAVCAPTLRCLGSVLSLGQGQGVTGRYANAEAEKVNLLESVFAESNLRQTAKETHEAFHLLGMASPERLVAMAVRDSDQMLRLAFTWDQVNSLQQEAFGYERDVRSRMQGSQVESETVSRSLQVEHSSDQDEHGGDIKDLFRLDVFSSELLVPTRDEAQDVAFKCLTNAGDDDGQGVGCLLTVPLSEVLELSLSPFIHAQHRLVSCSVLEALFSTDRFDIHLRLMRQIYLFGDGIFTARLARALFADVRDGAGGGGDEEEVDAGLRLQTRDSWPPASSELRLALMGILSESVRRVAVASISPTPTMTASIVRELEETTSFAIRDPQQMSDDELEACRDINSIHALDFLKLQYKPISISSSSTSEFGSGSGSGSNSNLLLEAVLTNDESLGKYDLIFKHLLRVLRMKTVAQDLLLLSRGRREGRTAFPTSRTTRTGATTTKFGVEIQHFMTNLADYCANVAIGEPWARMQTAFEGIRSRSKLLDCQRDCHDYNHGHGYDYRKGYGGEAEGWRDAGRGEGGLALLRNVHSSTLDEILRALLLPVPVSGSGPGQGPGPVPVQQPRKGETEAQAEAEAMRMAAIQTLENLFNLVLGYAATAQRRHQQFGAGSAAAAADDDDDDEGDNDDNDDKIKILHLQFRHHVRRFLKFVAAAAAATAASGSPAGTGGIGGRGTDLLRHLLLVLDFNSFSTA